MSAYRAAPSVAHRLPRGHLLGQRGLTIVELMVSVTIGLLIVGAVLYVYLGSRGAYRTSKSTSRVQEAGRFGLDAILRDVRQAGFIGCGSRVSLSNFQPQSIYQLATPQLAFNSAGQAIVGYPGSTYVPPTQYALTVPTIPADDVLTMHVGGTAASGVAMVKAPDLTIPAVYLANNCAKIKADSYLLLSSCSMATVIRVSNNPDTSTAACPANQSVPGGVEFDYTAADASGKTINVFPNGSTSLVPPLHSPPTLSSMAGVQVFDEIIYYIGQLPNRATGLYRYSAMNAVSEEIIDHVDNMCVLYGVKNAAGAVNYQTAATVTDWTSVVGVQVSLLTSGDDSGVVGAGQQPQLPWCAGTTTPADTKLHQVFTATAALRDQLK